MTLDRLDLLNFHEVAEDGEADILLLAEFSCLGRDMDKVYSYWYWLRGLGAGVHTADWAEVDLSLNMLLREAMDDMRKLPR